MPTYKLEAIVLRAREYGETDRLVTLLDQYPQVSRPHMGFPGHWDTEPFWQAAAKNAREGVKA